MTAVILSLVLGVNLGFLLGAAWASRGRIPFEDVPE